MESQNNSATIPSQQNPTPTPGITQTTEEILTAHPVADNVTNNNSHRCSWVALAVGGAYTALTAIGSFAARKTAKYTDSEIDIKTTPKAKI